MKGWIDKANLIKPLSAESGVYKLHRSASLTMEKFKLFTYKGIKSIQIYKHYYRDNFLISVSLLQIIRSLTEITSTQRERVSFLSKRKKHLEWVNVGEKIGPNSQYVTVSTCIDQMFINFFGVSKQLIW